MKELFNFPSSCQVSWLSEVSQCDQSLLRSTLNFIMLVVKGNRKETTIFTYLIYLTYVNLKWVKWAKAFMWIRVFFQFTKSWNDAFRNGKECQTFTAKPTHTLCTWAAVCSFMNTIQQPKKQIFDIHLFWT